MLYHLSRTPPLRGNGCMNFFGYTKADAKIYTAVEDYSCIVFYSDRVWGQIIERNMHTVVRHLLS